MKRLGSYRPTLLDKVASSKGPSVAAWNDGHAGAMVSIIGRQTVWENPKASKVTPNLALTKPDSWVSKI